MNKIQNTPKKHITRAVIGGAKTAPLPKETRSSSKQKEFVVDGKGYFNWVGQKK